MSIFCNFVIVGHTANKFQRNVSVSRRTMRAEKCLKLAIIDRGSWLLWNSESSSNRGKNVNILVSRRPLKTCIRLCLSLVKTSITINPITTTTYTFSDAFGDRNALADVLLVNTWLMKMDYQSHFPKRRRKQYRVIVRYLINYDRDVSHHTLFMPLGL